MTLIFVFCMFSLASAADQEVAREFDISPQWTLIHRVSNGLDILFNYLAMSPLFFILDPHEASLHHQKMK